MPEVGSKKDKAQTQKYILGKPSITPANVDEVDLEKLSVELAGDAAAFAAMADDDTDTTAPAFTVMRHPDTNDIHTLTAELTEEDADKLKSKYKGALLVEPDHQLFMQTTEATFEMSQLPITAANSSNELKITLKVVDENGAPVGSARVDLAGEVWSDQQMTNAQGRVALKLFGETLDSLTELRIKPALDHWSRIIQQPAFAAKENTVTVTSLPASLDAPQVNLWGNDAIGNVQMPASDRIRVAVIDSGFADGHPDVVAAGGRGFAAEGNPEEDWKTDDSGHGTHVAGTISALNNGIGMRGVADRVDVFALRVFPGASFSKLIAAIDEAIALKVDVVNMSLGGANQSDLLQQRMQAAREAGILLVAAAGNSGGAVMYPAAYPEVMAVSAIGKFGTFPEDSFHSRHVTDHVTSDGSCFAARFTCRGPEIDVCGPGVAIVSTLPGPGFGSYDGTSMASPHVAGIAAVLLAQRPDIHGMPRNGARSKTLFQAVLGSCQSLGLPPELQGHGMPTLTADNISAPPSDDGIDVIADLIRKALEAAKTIKETT
ncbi:S8 family peptidase [Yoonia maritima]|uniref:S8 family peptidase n=1 Tax=Yoonia maritima TaxID=1435347 RepID=UPI000D0FAEFF|nr:S8 family peptidase [Yoonia maritima]